jgi:hypothetical protein
MDIANDLDAQGGGRSGSIGGTMALDYLLRLSNDQVSADLGRLNGNVAQRNIAAGGIDEDVPAQSVAEQIQPIAAVIDCFLKHGARPLRLPFVQGVSGSSAAGSTAPASRFQPLTPQPSPSGRLRCRFRQDGSAGRV